MFRKLLLALAAVCLMTGSAVAADTFPNRPITIVVPFAAGGETDLVARMLADGMRRRELTFLSAMCILLVSASFSVLFSSISSRGAFISVNGVRISCAVLTKKRVFSSDIFFCFLSAMTRKPTTDISTVSRT